MEPRPEPRQAASRVHDLNHHPLEHKVCGGSGGSGREDVKIAGCKSSERSVRQSKTFIIREELGFGRRTDEHSHSALVITGRVA